MTTFSYTTGNPANLTGGHAASMSDISGPFSDIPTWLNGGNIDTGNLAASAKPVTLLGQYRTVADTAGGLTSGSGTNTSGIKVFSSGALFSNASSLSGTNLSLIPVLSADWAVSGLTAKLRVRSEVATNATAPAMTFTFGLYPVTVAGGTNVLVPTAGTVVAGSTAAAATPSASTVTPAVGSDFSLPSDGAYLLGVNFSGAMATNAAVALWCRLEVHHV